MVIDFNFNDEKLNVLWKEYQNKRNLGLKKDSNSLLNQFINQLKDKYINEEFVRFILGKVYDENVEFDLQYPLLKHIIFPVLVNDYKEKRMPGIRWLWQIPYIDEECNLKIDELVGSEELRETILLLALEVDNNDIISQQLLLHYYVSYLEFGIHELPQGLLISLDEGFEIVKKIEELIVKYKYDNLLVELITNAIYLYERLFSEWKEYKSQNEIKYFDIWCEMNNFDYCDCRSKIMSIPRIY